MCLQSQLLGRLRQENCLNPGGGGCSDLRLCYDIPASATEQDSVSERKERKKIRIETTALKYYVYHPTESMNLLS